MNLNMGQSTQLRLVEQVHRYLFSIAMLCISISPKPSPPQRVMFFCVRKSVKSYVFGMLTKSSGLKTRRNKIFGVGSQVLRSWPRASPRPLENPWRRHWVSSLVLGHIRLWSQARDLTRTLRGPCRLATGHRPETAKSQP